jgi:hypothetical protein
MDLTTKIQAIIQASASNPLDLSTPVDNAKISKTLQLADGTGDSQADQSFHDQYTIAADSNEDIDLAGVLVDAFGDTVTFDAIKAIYIHNASDEIATPTEAQIEIGAEGSNPWSGMFGDPSDTIILEAGDFFLWTCHTAGKSVTAGTGDILRIANNEGAGGDNALVNVVIIGDTA